MQKATEELIIFLLVNIIVIVLIVSLVLTIIFFHRKKQITSKIKIEKLKTEYEKVILKTKLEIQEQTSHDIAREIHDSIGHGLTLAKLQLNTLLKLPSETDFNKVRMAVDLLGQSIQQLSDISKNLNAEALLQQGLLPAIDEEISRLRTLNRFEVQYEVNGFTSYMESQQEIVIYRVIQEGFQNILKHSDARCAQLQLHFHPEYFQVSLIDDGNGFDPSTPKRTRSTGLSNIENRIRFLSGEFQIQSSLKKGTRIQFTIPYQANVKFN